MMRFQVPQNIELEDKVIGPFTLKQFVYIIIGGIISFTLVKTIPSFVIMIFLVTINSLLWIIMALGKVNDRPFPQFLQNLFLFFLKPKIRKWAKGIITESIVTQPAKQKTKEAPAKQLPRQQLQELTKILDVGPAPEEKTLIQKRIKNIPPVPKPFQKEKTS